LRRSLACSSRCLRASAIRRVRRIASIRAAAANSSAKWRSRMALASRIHGEISRLVFLPRHIRWIRRADSAAIASWWAVCFARMPAATCRPRRPRHAICIREAAQTSLSCCRRRAHSRLASQPRARRWTSNAAARTSANSCLASWPRFQARHRRWIFLTARFASLPYRPSKAPHIHPEPTCMHETPVRPPVATDPALWHRGASGRRRVGFAHASSADSTGMPARSAAFAPRRRRERATGRTGCRSAPASSSGGCRRTPAVAGRRFGSLLCATHAVPEMPPDCPAFRRRSI
jgi:hypothetical protein